MLLRRIETTPGISQLLNNLMDADFVGHSPNWCKPNSTIPAVNIIENDSCFVIEMAAPGMSREDFKISLKNNLLTIAADSKENNEKEQPKYQLKEFCYKSFRRTFTLAEKSVDFDKINAKYVNGELIIAIPKKEEAKPKEPKLIEVL